MFERFARFWGRRSSRSLKVTRAGWISILLSLGVGLGALNTGNNLLYIVFGGVLGLILSSGLVSEKNLRGLEPDWIVPEEIYAKRETLVRLLLRNGKAASSVGLEAEARFEGRGRLSWSGWFFSIPGRSQRSADISFVAPSRGLHNLIGVSISTEFPFGLFRKTTHLFRSGSLLIYPAVDSASVLDVMIPGNELHRAAQRGEGESFWGLREFVAGDSPRRVSWKTSARLGKLVVSETEREREEKVILSLDPAEDWRALSSVDLEKAVSFAASLACVLLEKGAAVGMAFSGFVLSPSSAPDQRHRLLKYLAVYDPSLKPPETRELFPDVPRLPVLALWRSS